MLERFWKVLAGVGIVWEGFGRCSEGVGKVLGRFWEGVGRFWEGFGKILEGLGRFRKGLRRFWKVLGRLHLQRPGALQERCSGKIRRRSPEASKPRSSEARNGNISIEIIDQHTAAAAVAAAAPRPARSAARRAGWARAPPTRLVGTR